MPRPEQICKHITYKGLNRTFYANSEKELKKKVSTILAMKKYDETQPIYCYRKWEPYKNQLCYICPESNGKYHIPPRPSYVYFITDGDYVKIGKSENPNARLTEVQCGNPHELKIAHKIMCNNSESAFDLERHLQSKYWDFHVRGEWFRADKVLNFIDERTYEVDLMLDKYIVSKLGGGICGK